MNCGYTITIWLGGPGGLHSWEACEQFPRLGKKPRIGHGFGLLTTDEVFAAARAWIREQQDIDRRAHRPVTAGRVE